MAATDDYINSEGLNVKRKDHPTEKKSKTKQERTTTTQQQQLGTATESNIRKQGQGTTANIEAKLPQSKYMRDSVAQVINEKSIEDKATKSPTRTNLPMIVMPTPTRMLPNDDKSIDSDEGNDPIMSMIGNERNRSQTIENMTVSIKDPPRKDPNRFLDDLEARVSKNVDSNDDIESPTSAQNTQHPPHSQTQPQQPLNLLQSFTDTPNKMDWLRSVTPQSIQKSMSQIIPGMKRNPSPISKSERQPLRQSNQSKDDLDDEERVNLVQSSALIGDHENAELMRIRQRMNMDFITMALDILDKNRHYSLIVVTFFVTAFGYFLTRNKTDDSVTR